MNIMAIYFKVENGTVKEKDKDSLILFESKGVSIYYKGIESSEIGSIVDSYRDGSLQSYLNINQTSFDTFFLLIEDSQRGQVEVYNDFFWEQ